MTTTDQLQVIVDTSICCGSGMCASLAPTAFEVDETGIVAVLAGAQDCSLDELARAARSCPTLCIRLARDGQDVELY